MHHLAIHIEVPREPECPICRDRLLPDSVTFYNSIALCRSCLQATPQAVMYAAIQSARRIELHDHWSCSHGLSFFTPKITARRNVAAHLLGEQHDHPHVTYNDTLP